MSERKVDWAKLEAVYIHSNISLRAMSIEHGVGLATLKSYSASRNWVRRRREASEQVAARLHRDAMRSRVEQIKEWGDGDLIVAKALRSQISQQLVRLNGAVGISDDERLERLALISRTAESAQRIARLALGATTSNTGIAEMPAVDPPTLGDLYRTCVIVSAKSPDAGTDDGTEH